MKRGTTAVISIPHENFQDLPLSRQIQIRRVNKVIAKELTSCQREILVAYYFQQKTIPEIAEERQINKSTVSRTLRRAEDRVRRCLRY